MLTFLVFLFYDQGCKAIFSILNVFRGDLQLTAAQLGNLLCEICRVSENIRVDSAVQVPSTEPETCPCPSQCSQEPGSSEGTGLITYRVIPTVASQ